MSFPHHGDVPPFGDVPNATPELMKLFQEQRRGTAKRVWPERRVSADDDGAIVFKVGADPQKNIVAIEFSHPTNWIGMSPEQAVEMAQSLIKYARSIATKPIQIVLH